MRKGQKLTDNTDLKSRRESDDYHVERIVKFTLLAAFVIIVLSLLGYFLMRVSTDFPFRNGVLDIVKQNLSGIVFFGLTLLGLNKYNKK